MSSKWKLGKKRRNILIVYAIIFACGLYIVFIDYAFVNNQIIIFERNINLINAPNYGLVKEKTQLMVDVKKQERVREWPKLPYTRFDLGYEIK